ncbi:beta-glucosidase [Brevundimonas sp. Leaf363]|uniref:beta-glucosidase family protein n=1 Tax=Brevundimonas sp. Leaf363 TaxID=1736353 RepID=UPI0006FA8366|nr:beta-glucosidase [Brevundimonas sp. Leaf363]KQS54392.1 beta-glucosidase [Brevundimonas sp. Leaf363]
MSFVRVSSVSIELRALVLCGAAALALTSVSPALAQAAALTPAASVADARARADRLLAQMTQDEKLAMVHGYFPPLAERTPGAPLDQMIPSAGYVPGVPRLGIPALRESDASLGVANQVEQRKGDVATALPSSLATAATFDPSIAYAGGAMIGAEAHAKTFNVLLAGGVNLTRDPWNGRNFEYLGEDPLLAGVLAGEHIRGVQSNRIVSTVKHYALNSQETGRGILNAVIDEAGLRESDLLAFQIAIELGRPGSVMCAYNKVNGDWSCENDFLLNHVLKADWSYPGFVMSDWGGVHSTAYAANNGLDQQSGQELDSQIWFGAPLVAALATGEVPQARLDDMVRRILVGMIESGAIDNPVPATAQTIDYATNAQVSQHAIEQGAVLLKNEGDILPAARTARRIVLVGGHADVGVLSGGGSSQVRSVGGAPVEIPLTSGAAASFARTTWHASSPLRAIQAIAPDAEVTYVSGDDAAAAAEAVRSADLAVVFAVQWTTEAQDVENISLPDGQDALISAVAAANAKTVVVLETGGPVLMPWLDRVPAVLQAWYPGQRGGEAIARILFGEVNPSGRLPITFPRSGDQAPREHPVGMDALRASEAAAASNPGAGSSAAFASFDVQYPEGSDVGYRWYDLKDATPLFPFGYGLSYTDFNYGGLTVEGGQTVTVTLDVTNAGDRAGIETPQLYVTAENGVRRLAGWARVALQPGETRRVTITAEPRILAEYDTALPGWRIAAGPHAVAVARNAIDAGLTGSADLTPRTIKP